MDPRLLDILKMELQVHGDEICFINGPLDLTMLLGIAAQERAHQKELQVEYFLRTGARCVPPAACPRLGTAAQDLRCVYTQELKLAERLDAAANTAPSPLHPTLAAKAQQDRCHAQAVRNLLACLLG